MKEVTSNRAQWKLALAGMMFLCLSFFLSASWTALLFSVCFSRYL